MVISGDASVLFDVEEREASWGPARKELISSTLNSVKSNTSISLALVGRDIR
jgi:hypothetical protein